MVLIGIDWLSYEFIPRCLLLLLKSDDSEMWPSWKVAQDQKASDKESEREKI